MRTMIRSSGVGRRLASAAGRRHLVGRQQVLTGPGRQHPWRSIVVRARAAGRTLSAHQSGVSWVLVTKRDDFPGDAVVALVGAHPWGPFRERVLFGSRTTAGRLEYLPLAHPELPLQDGSLLVSLNHNNIDLNVVLADPAAFRPTFHTVQGLG